MTFEFEPPERCLNLNDRVSPHQRARITRVWRHAAFVYACTARPGGPAKRALGAGRWAVTVSVPVKGRLRRDPSNWAPTVKAVVDGLVDAGFWPDDSSEFVTVREPVLTHTGRVVVLIEKVGR